MLTAGSPPPLNDSLLRTVMDANPAMMFVVDETVSILDCNAAALRLFSGEAPPFQRRGGDALQCLQAANHAQGCGHAWSCHDCVIRNAVDEAIRGEKTCRKRTVLELVKGDHTVDLYALVTAVPFEHVGQHLVLLTIEDISVLTELWRVVPICSCCKKIRGDDANWVSLEDYFRTHWDLRFTHGYCPACQAAQMAGRSSSKCPSTHPCSGSDL